MGKRFIVVDIGIKEFRNNAVLDPEFSERYPGATVLSTLKQVAEQHGWSTVTGDVFLAAKPSFEQAVCLSNEATPELSEILRRGATPGLLVSGESPNVAWTFYHNLRRSSNGFRYACLFRGARDRVHEDTIFRTHFWPMPSAIAPGHIEFSQRRLLGMVVSFKERFGMNRTRLISRLISPLRWTRILWYQLIDSSARFTDLYQVRISAVRFFASKEDFHLYGRNWSMAVQHVKAIRRLPFANRPKPCEDKLRTLSFYRFALVMENCIFPGYITEKLFDAMLAGTVPIYLGAPDIEDFVPTCCFVDLRQYSDFQELWDDISSWTQDRWTKYILAIREFIESDKYRPFREETVAENWFEWLTEGL